MKLPLTANVIFDHEFGYNLPLRVGFSIMSPIFTFWVGLKTVSPSRVVEEEDEEDEEGRGKK